jgi:hypothetical protein
VYVGPWALAGERNPNDRSGSFTHEVGAQNNTPVAHQTATHPAPDPAFCVEQQGAQMCRYGAPSDARLVTFGTRVLSPRS